MPLYRSNAAQKSTRRRLARSATRRAICAAVLILCASVAIWLIVRLLAGGARPELATAKVTLGANTVKFGHDLEIRIDGAAEDWSGELTVNQVHNFPLNSRVFRLRANSRNGFEAGRAAELYVLLVDSKGRQIPVSNAGRFRVEIIPSLATLDREGRAVDPDGLSSSFEVTARPDYHWSVTRVPEWIKINSGQTGAGSGAVSYTVLKNETNEERAADLAVGDGSFKITQAHPSAIQVPFLEKFQYPAPPPEFWTLLHRGKATPEDSPVRWTWEQLNRQRVIVGLASESASGGNSLLIQRTRADEHEWTTQVYLPHLDFHFGAEYPLTLWMKTENPAEVSVALSQSTTPWTVCGGRRAFHVSQAWTKYDMPLKVTVQNCEPDNNRLVFSVGKIKGKLWISDLSIGSSQ